MQMQCEYRLAEIQCLAKLANIQRTEIPHRSGTEHLEIPKGNLANSPGLMKYGQILTQRFNNFAAHSKPPSKHLIAKHA